MVYKYRREADNICITLNHLRGVTCHSSTLFVMTHHRATRWREFKSQPDNLDGGLWHLTSPSAPTSFFHPSSDESGPSPLINGLPPLQHPSSARKRRNPILPNPPLRRLLRYIYSTPLHEYRLIVADKVHTFERRRRKTTRQYRWCCGSV